MANEITLAMRVPLLTHVARSIERSTVSRAVGLTRDHLSDESGIAHTWPIAGPIAVEVGVRFPDQ